MADDWRLTVELEEEGHGLQLARVLHERELETEVRERLGKRVIVSRDGPRIFLYADTRERAREAERIVRLLLDEEGVPAELTLHRWHPIEEQWEDASVPLPRTEKERQAERERLGERETAESLASGHAEWEVRVELPSHNETVALAEQLEGEGVPVVRRWTYLLAGAASEDDARALAARLESESPAGSRVEVQPSGDLIWEVAPRNPFTIFGGLGA